MVPVAYALDVDHPIAVEGNQDQPDEHGARRDTAVRPRGRRRGREGVRIWGPALHRFLMQSSSCRGGILLPGVPHPTHEGDQHACLQRSPGVTPAMERLWAPWRMAYLQIEKPTGCIF